MATKTDTSTEKLILDAAKTIFTLKGHAGTRMQEVADEAGISKSMLHYYFRSKDKLFGVIFNETLDVLAPMILEILSRDASVIDKLEALVDAELSVNTEQPHIAIFILNELAQNPEGLQDKLREKIGDQRILVNFAEQTHKEIADGTLRDYDPVHLVINVLSMSIFPFVAKPMLEVMGEMGGAGYSRMIASRAAAVKQFVRMALVKD